ncbi:MAG: FHA domain-containing protein [Clostridium sp.]|nr:FHA domain-containing protein [Clostridium sp.]MCI7442872.1 FHA domain-containing protein [Clostridium sp.]
MDFSKLMAIVFGVIFIIILYFIIYYALKIMYKDIKVNNVRNENLSKLPKKKVKKNYGIEVISPGENSNIKKGTIIPIIDIITIGRKEDNSVVLQDMHTSGNHAKLVVKENNLYIQDLHSTNGTFVNGRKISTNVKLLGREEIQIGTTVFRVLA